MLAGDCSRPAETSNSGFCSRWNHLKENRLHSDICNVRLCLLSGVKIQIKLTKAKKSFYLLSTKADSKATFKFQEVLLYAKRIRPALSILASHTEALLKGYSARYNFTRFELKTFTFAKGSQSLSIDNAVLGVLPKRLLFPMVRNTDFLGTKDSNPFKFRHYDFEHFTLYVSGKQIPSEGLSLDMGHEKTSVMGYRTLFGGSGIYHSNTGLQITPVLYINGYFMLVFDQTGNASDSVHGNVHLEMKFAKALPDPLVCLLYLEYDGSILIDALRTVTTDF
jgi:hypothetical protein